jgi:lysophospholipase L1-like esterase
VTWRPDALAILRYRFFVRRLLLFFPLLMALSACGTPAPAASQPTPTRSTPILIRSHPGTYVALGASETYGVGAQPYTQGYAYRVAKALHARRFLDLGIPGTTLDAGYQSELTRALAVHPALCTVFFGVNDLRAGVTRNNFAQELHDLVATLRRGGAKVVIVGMPNLGLLPAASAFPDAGTLSAAWNAAMARDARQTGATFLDLSRFSQELASHPGYVAPDGLHPSNQGHARLAQVVVAAIRVHHLWTPR